jgi:hypothetical protein
MKWTEIGLLLGILTAFAKLLDSLLPDAVNLKLKDLFYHSWLAMESLSVEGLFRRAGKFFDRMFTAMMNSGEGMVHGLMRLLFFYLCLSGLILVLVLEKEFPIGFSRNVVGSGFIKQLVSLWVWAVLIGAVGLSHVLSQLFVSTITDFKAGRSALLLWIVDVLLGALLALISYCLIVWCFPEHWRQVPGRLVLVVFAPKIIHLVILVVFALIYLFEGTRRMVAFIFERVFGSKDGVLTILLLVIDLFVAVIAFVVEKVGKQAAG